MDFSLDRGSTPLYSTILNILKGCSKGVSGTAVAKFSSALS